MSGNHRNPSIGLRAALIGCGKIGVEFADEARVGVYSHVCAYAACPRTELVAVCDTDADKAERAAHRWNARSYADPGRLLAETRPEIVSLCTPDDTHAALLDMILRADGVKAVLAEKPLALELADARRLVALARRRGIRLAVNYSRRFAPGHRELAEQLRQGLIGEIRQVRGLYTKGTIHNGTHWFDWARMLVGEITAVRGFDTLGEGGEDPTLDARLEFALGAAGHLAALDHRDYSVFEIDLLGTRGRLRIFDSGHRYRLERVGDSPHYAGYRALLPDREEDAGLHDTLLHAVTDLVESIESGREPACTGEDAVKTLAVAQACRNSARRGGRRWIVKAP